LTDQERTALSLAESIQNLFEEHAATKTERHSAIQIVAAMIPLVPDRVEDSVLPTDAR
jgi:hypothetical protein